MSFFGAILDWLRSLFWKQEMELTLVGLQGAGKTTLLTAMMEGKRHIQQYASAARDPAKVGTADAASVPDTIPTIGLNTRKVTYGNVSIKLWDIGGQPRFRTMWERYCRGVNCVVFVVDAQDQASFEAAKVCLHDLMSKPTLANIPLLVLGNKCDLPDACDEQTLSQCLELPKLAKSRGGRNGLVQMPLFAKKNGANPPSPSTDVSKESSASPQSAASGEAPATGSDEGREVCCYHLSAKNYVNVDVVMNWLIKHAGKTSATEASA